MAFDKPTRNALSRMVAACRRWPATARAHRQLIADGIQPDGTTLAVDKLAHLDDRGREIATGLREWLEHLFASEAGTEEQRRKNAFFRMAQETAFTYLNRLAALRMCEERGLVIECVRRGMESDGFALYERLARQLLGDRGQTYRVFLECMFDELAVDLGTLFDRRVPHALVFPTPVGDASLPSKPYIEDMYADTKGDVYKAFVECFQDRLVPTGMLGIISSRTGFFLGQSADWRERIVLRLYRPVTLADFGPGVLDAMVETAAYVLRTLSNAEDRQLTLRLVPEIMEVPSDKDGCFSIPKYQKKRDGLKRHQAEGEIERLLQAGYIVEVPGHFRRFQPQDTSIRSSPAPQPESFDALMCFRLVDVEDKGDQLAEPWHIAWKRWEAWEHHEPDIGLSTGDGPTPAGSCASYPVGGGAAHHRLVWLTGQGRRQTGQRPRSLDHRGFRPASV